MITRRFSLSSLVTLILSAVSLSLSAQIPAGYYDRANGKSGAELKTAMRDIIYNHTEVSSYSALPSYFEKTDMYPNSNRWWDMYSDEFLYGPSFSGLNREHAFPKSWWGGVDVDTPAYVDLFHLYPSEAKANSAKSNWPLGEVATPTFNNGVSVVGYPVSGQGGGATRVFEPDDEYKGDFARTYFYVVTCYSNLTWSSKYMWMLRQGAYPTLTEWAIDLLLKWHREDPVSEKERNRQEAVYRIQGNRNPFIDLYDDNPDNDLATYIWGDKKNDIYHVDVDTNTDPMLVSPAAGTTLDFTQVAIGNSATSKLFIKTSAVTANLRIQIYKGDTSMFSVSASDISYASTNSPQGYWLDVTYSPTSTGTHSATMLISGGNMASSIGVGLLGECLDVPTLNTLTATEATLIDLDSYQANWNIPANDVVDYYLVTRTKYVNGVPSVEELPAEQNFIEITDFADSDYDTYSVQSSRLGYFSEPSNVITVRHSGSIEDIKLHEELELIPVEGGIFVVAGNAHSSAIIYDTLGRTVKSIPELRDGMTISLASGTYIFVTPRLTPIKVTI